MDISKLSKAELIKNNEKLVQEFLIKQGYEVIKVLGDKVQTKYKIYKEYQKQKTFLKLNYMENPNTHLDRHKIAACMLYAIVKIYIKNNKFLY